MHLKARKAAVVTTAADEKPKSSNRDKSAPNKGKMVTKKGSPGS